jgi:hypothetical protein
MLIQTNLSGNFSSPKKGTGPVVDTAGFSCLPRISPLMYCLPLQSEAEKRLCATPGDALFIDPYLSFDSRADYYLGINEIVCFSQTFFSMT